MLSVQLRVPLGLGHRLYEAVFAKGRHEYIAICLVSTSETKRGSILLVRHVIELVESDYIADAPHGAAWSGSAMFPAIALAVREGLGIFIVHSHAFGSPPRLSSDDLESARRLLPMFQRRMPGRPHGSIVLSPRDAGGVVALPGRAGVAARVSVRWLSKAIIDWPLAPSSAAADEVFDRQALVVGDQDRLRRARVCVVGLSGGGSHVVQQLAHGGVGTIVGVDDDMCELTNLQRNVVMQRRDADRREPKTDVAGRRVRAIGSGSKFVGVRARVPEPAALEALQSADIIVGCVDTLQARAHLQEAAWRNLVPYVDIGVGIRSLKSNAMGPRVSIGGNVLVLIPGGFCMWCCGFLSDEGLDAERGGLPATYFQNKKGQAQVVSFNGVVASQGVSEVLQLLTAYRGTSLNPSALRLKSGQQRGFLKYDGVRGTVEEWGAARSATCPCCGALLGSGVVLWTAPTLATNQ